jgi:gamma-glutamyltranspeptidase/glutathione hydrolase
MFCLYYDAKTKKVSAMNGSGRSGSGVTLEKIRKDLNIPDGENGQIPMDSVHAATVPGAAAGWVDCHERFGSGKVTLEEVLAPAIDLAENGFPVSELSATFVSIVDVFGDLTDMCSGRKANQPCGRHHLMGMKC